MASPQPVLRQVRDPHIHALSETCPTCDQPIPNEKAQEIRAKMEAHERSLANAANARAAEQIAAEKTRIEAAANAAVDQLRKEKDEALKKANADAAAKAEAARVEGRKAAEAALQQVVTDAQRAKADAEAAAAHRVAAIERAANTAKEEAAQKITAADSEKRDALAAVQALKERQEVLIGERVTEARDALERDKTEALATAKATYDGEIQKLSAKLETLQRQIDKQRADELGEGAEVKLFDALKAEFSGDDIRRVKKGVSGADILHTVIHNGKPSGTIIYDSKNITAWRDDYVTKLIRDQTAAKAEHAILSTFKFPAGTSQVEVRDGVIIVNPARAIAIARIVRKHMALVHTLRLSKSDRTKKMAALYDFITSERCALLLARIESEAESLLEMQTNEKKAHDNHWKKQGLLLRSIQKVKADLETEIDLIIGGNEEDGRDADEA